MEEKRKRRPQFLFLIPILVIFCGFFMPLAGVASYTVFRGKELFELYGQYIHNAPPPSGYGLLVSLFRAIPFLALPALVVAGLGWRETPYVASAFALVCLGLAIGLVGPGYVPLVTLADPGALGMPAAHPGPVGLIVGGHVGRGFILMVVSSAFLVAYSAYFVATGGGGGLTRRIENFVHGAAERNMRRSMMLAALPGLWGIFYAVTENGVFMSARNLSILFLQSAATAVIAVGVVLVLVTGNIDLSVGSVVGFVGAAAAVTQVDSPASAWLAGVLESLGLPPDGMAILGVAAGLLVGLAIGAWQGLWIAYLGVPAFIVTLSGMMIFRGGILYFTGGKSVANMYPWFQAIGQEYLSVAASKYLAAAVVAAYLVREIRRRFARGRYGFATSPLPLHILKLFAVSAAIVCFFGIMIEYRGVPYAWLIVMAMMLALSFAAEKTAFGRQLYAIGGNPDAARLSGIDVRGRIFSMYALMGGVVAIGGIVYLSRLNSATSNAGSGMELDCIAAAMIGGASLRGGEGGVYGGVIGALVMGSLDNGMSLLNLDATWQYTVKGLVLLLAVFVDMLSRKRDDVRN